MGPARRRLIVAIVMACTIGVAIAGRYKEYGRPSSEVRLLEAPERPAPDRKFSSPRDCARACRPGEQPKTCHYTFVVEFYATLTNACKFCQQNATTKLGDGHCQCISADGYEKSGIITVNRLYPGPTIVVCEGDIVVADVYNNVFGNEVTVHWHGILQRGTPFYDGVPMVSQCPIPQGTGFRYQFVAGNAGTHFYHSHTGLQKITGFEGALVIREPKATEPFSELWDEEDINHIMFFSDIFHDSPEERIPGTIRRNPGQSPDNILINGMGQWRNPATGIKTNSSLAVFEVKPGVRYRFRLIFGVSQTCPLILTIEGHKLTAIASDGEPFKPVEVDSISGFSGERYDCVITTVKNRKPGDVWIQLRAGGNCESRQLSQLAILRYVVPGQAAVPPTREPTFTPGLPQGVVLNKINVRCDNRTVVKDAVCITQLESVEPVPTGLLKKIPDEKFIFPFGFFRYDEGEAFTPGSYPRFLVNGGREFASLVSNISNVLPPSPLISQLSEIPPGQICEPGKTPASCANRKKPCFCTHVRKIRLGAVTEIMFVDTAQIPNLSHAFHLHGSGFHVLGQGCGDDYGIPSITVDIAKELDKTGQIVRQWDKPPAKDTFALPNNGFTVVRFIADNPGFWMLHCHFLSHLEDGMSVILQIGEISQHPPIPRGFPRCGNFLPPLEI